MIKKIFFTDILLLLFLIIFIYAGRNNFLIILSILTWVYLSILAEKHVWLFFSRNWIEDRLVNIIIMIMGGVAVGVCVNKFAENHFMILPIIILHLIYLSTYLKGYRLSETLQKENITVFMLGIISLSIISIWYFECLRI